MSKTVLYSSIIRPHLASIMKLALNSCQKETEKLVYVIEQTKLNIHSESQSAKMVEEGLLMSKLIHEMFTVCDFSSSIPCVAVSQDNKAVRLILNVTKLCGLDKIDMTLKELDYSEFLKGWESLSCIDQANLIANSVIANPGTPIMENSNILIKNANLTDHGQHILELSFDNDTEPNLVEAVLTGHYTNDLTLISDIWPHPSPKSCAILTSSSKKRPLSGFAMYSLNATSEMPVLFISVICIDKRVKHKKLLVPFVDGLVRPVLAKHCPLRVEVAVTPSHAALKEWYTNGFRICEEYNEKKSAELDERVEDLLKSYSKAADMEEFTPDESGISVMEPICKDLLDLGVTLSSSSTLVLFKVINGDGDGDGQ